MTIKQRSEEYVKHLKKKKYYMKPTYKDIRMVSMGGDRHAPYDIALDYIPNNGIVYSFGLGDEIGLEEKLIKAKQCIIYGYDPMPDSEKYIKECNLANMHFRRLALTNHDDEEKCYYPENRNYISGSLRKENVGWGNFSEDYFLVECHRLKTIMQINNHSHIHLLKLCVEGAEFEVMDDIMKERLEIDQIAIAFCGRGVRGMFEKEREIYHKLRQNGYECLPYEFSGKITFIKSEIIGK